MTNKCAKQVVIISDIKNSNIEQAIFILKNNETIENKNQIINEANEIIYNYVCRTDSGLFREVKKKKKWFMNKDQKDKH